MIKLMAVIMLLGLIIITENFGLSFILALTFEMSLYFVIMKRKGRL